MHPRGKDMKSVYLGIAAAVLLSVVAWFVTEEIGTNSQDQFTSPNNTVRLD